MNEIKRSKGSDEKFCQECAAIIKAKAVICPKCGCPSAVKTSVLGDGRNKTTAGILALFLGGLGLQYFYIGKHLSGVLCILFCWTYIPVVVGLIEGIYYLTMTNKKFNEKFSGQPFTA